MKLNIKNPISHLNAGSRREYLKTHDRIGKLRAQIKRGDRR